LISLFIAVAAGYVLGILIPGRWLPFVLCFPASILVYSFIIMVWGAFSTEGIELPSMVKFIAVSLLQMPLLMIGVYWARRKEKQRKFEFN